MKKVKNIYILILCFLFVYLFAFIGSAFTSASVDSEWYYSIKPNITPPNWVFPVVWNILFFLIALSLFFVWIKSSKKQKPKIAILFGANLFLNILWSFSFFFLQNPTLAFADLILLEVSIIAIILFVKKIEKKSAWLLVPYLLWVGFAGILNYLIAF
jgi:tryptophan-rich sensory protein